MRITKRKENEASTNAAVENAIHGLLLSVAKSDAQSPHFFVWQGCFWGAHPHNIWLRLCPIRAKASESVTHRKAMIWVVTLPGTPCCYKYWESRLKTFPNLFIGTKKVQNLSGFCTTQTTFWEICNTPKSRSCSRKHEKRKPPRMIQLCRLQPCSYCEKELNSLIYYAFIYFISFFMCD